MPSTSLRKRQAIPRALRIEETIIRRIDGPDELTKAEDAARRYLAGDETGFNHLLGICIIAARGIKWPIKTLTTKVTEKLIFADGKFKAVPCRYVVNETEAAIKEWITYWLVERLAPYRAGKIPEAREFRYLPRKCRQALIDESRKLGAAKRRGLEYSFDAELPQSGDDVSQRPSTFMDFFVQTPDTTLMSSLGRQSGPEPEQLKKYADSLQLAPRNQAVLDEILGSYFAPSKKSDIDGRIAAKLGVSDRQARTIRKKFQQEMSNRLIRREPGAIALSEYLEKPKYGTAYMHKNEQSGLPKLER